MSAKGIEHRSHLTLVSLFTVGWDVSDTWLDVTRGDIDFSKNNPDIRQSSNHTVDGSEARLTIWDV